MKLRRLDSHGYTRTRWKNDLGWTREILRHPAGSEDWDWRLSIAEVDSDAPFSAFPGCDRVLVLLAGEGMRLCFDDGETVPLEPPHGSCRFAGERGLHAELVSGPTQDFNAIWRRDRVQVDVLHRPLVGAMVFFREPAVAWLVYVLEGWAEFKDLPAPFALNAGDSALLEASGELPSRLILNGGGEVLLVKISAAASA